MKYDKKIEQLIAAPASTWSDDDVTAIALAIKSHPDDDNLKNAFLNLNPRSEQYCNRAFYISLTSLYFWIVCQYNAIYTLDEFIEAVSYHIWNKSFADWRPGDSLMGYIKYSSLPHGPIGRDIRINYYLLDAVHLDDPANSSMLSTLADEKSPSPESHILSEKSDLVEAIKKIANLSDMEITLLIDLQGTRLSTLYIAGFNAQFGTNYTLSELRDIREKARHRVKYHTEEFQRILKKYHLI